MGYLTTITIYNDALGEFEKSPKEFAEAIFKGITQANFEYKEVSVPFQSHCNYISVQPSRHADAETVYVHTGNCVFNLFPYGQDFRDLAARPEILKNFINVAKRVIQNAEEELKRYEAT